MLPFVPFFSVHPCRRLDAPRLPDLPPLLFSAPALFLPPGIYRPGFGAPGVVPPLALFGCLFFPLSLFFAPLITQIPHWLLRSSDFSPSLANVVPPFLFVISIGMFSPPSNPHAEFFFLEFFPTAGPGCCPVFPRWHPFLPMK